MVGYTPKGMELAQDTLVLFVGFFCWLWIEKLML